MIRVAHLADSHFDETNRLDDNVAVHEAFVEQAREARVGLIVHPGDFFERRSTPRERNALKEFVKRACDVAPLFGVKGNHDVAGDLDIFGDLRTRYPVTILDRPTMVAEAILQEGPLARHTLALLALPWFDKAGLAARLPADADAGTIVERTISAARGLLLGLRMEANRCAAVGYTPILVGHVLVTGSEVSTGQTLTGQTVALAPSELLEVGAAYAALGHIHRAQSWHEGRVAYSGSPNRHDFGEPEVKGWNLVTIDPARWQLPGGVTVEFRELPARAMTRLEWNFDEIRAFAANGRWDALTMDVDRGSLVRFRYRIRPDDFHLVDEDAIKRAFLDAGAYEVQIERDPITEARIRSTEIVEAQTNLDICRAVWAAKGQDIPDDQVARVALILDRLEAAERGEAATTAAERSVAA